MTRTLVIAEAGVNHDGDLEKAFALVDVAVEAGADVVKFQSFRAEKLASRNAPKADYQIENVGSAESQYAMLKRLELSDEAHIRLVDYCAARNIEFLSTPFDVDGLKMLVEGLGLRRIKLGSSELTNAPLLLASAKTGRPVILSTGMGSMDEVRDALGVLAFGYSGSRDRPSRQSFREAVRLDRKLLTDKVILLHCSTSYPTPYEDANLTAMQTMREEFGVVVGYSDHTLGTHVSVAAVALGATVIEKHFTLDQTSPGPDHKASLEPDELKEMVGQIRCAEVLKQEDRASLLASTPGIATLMGSGVKELQKSEAANRYVARKGLVAAHDLKAGHILTPDDIEIKRPAAGPSPFEYWNLIGQKIDRDYFADDPFSVSEHYD